MNMNLVVLAGNLTSDPEMRFTATGTGIAEFSVAVNRKWKGADDEAKEEVSFFSCVAFGRTAETICEWFRKGGAICVEGRLQQQRWEDKATGKARSTIKVIVERFHFSGDSKGPKSGERTGPPAARRAAPAAAPAEAAEYAPAADDDSEKIPF